LFTIDEETGMTGALNLKGGILQGETVELRYRRR
jgi:dipeptidase D